VQTTGAPVSHSYPRLSLVVPLSFDTHKSIAGYRYRTIARHYCHLETFIDWFLQPFFVFRGSIFAYTDAVPLAQSSTTETAGPLLCFESYAPAQPPDDVSQCIPNRNSTTISFRRLLQSAYFARQHLRIAFFQLLPCPFAEPFTEPMVDPLWFYASGSTPADWRLQVPLRLEQPYSCSSEFSSDRSAPVSTRRQPYVTVTAYLWRSTRTASQNV
jgi:hypothetical protein